MKRFSDSIRSAVSAQNWFGALFLALAVPDVCGALEDPTLGVGVRYKKWFERYLKRKYDPANMFELMSDRFPDRVVATDPRMIEAWKASAPSPGPAFTADDCYRFRCRCLHEGLALKSKDEKIHFTAPLSSGGHVHRNLIYGLFQLQIDIFCLDICAAIDQWSLDVSENAGIQARMKDLIEIYDPTDPRLPIYGSA